MRKLLIASLSLLVFVGCTQNRAANMGERAENASPSVIREDAPKVKFEKEIYDFGVIEQGEVVHYNFTFKNNGKTPLIITDASSTCGCTIPELPEKPIKPGETAVIKVQFDSAGKIGMQDKQITLTSNASPEIEKLHMVGEIR